VKGLIVQIAKKAAVPVVMLIDTAHVYSDGYSRVVMVDKQADSVDFALMNLLKKGDVVVTQDYGLAAMALGKGAFVIHQNGWQYTNDNIDSLLRDRHVARKIRRHGGRTKGPAKRTKEDDDRFAAAFINLLDTAYVADERGRSSLQ
jgi:uncharacterized protein YaiI (UPF0178 family)